MKDLIERLRDWHNTSDECNRKDMIQAADLLERIYTQPVSLPEHVAWFDAATSERVATIHYEHAKGNLQFGELLYTGGQYIKGVQEATARALEAAARKMDERAARDETSNYFKVAANEIRNLIGGVK